MSRCLANLGGKYAEHLICVHILCNSSSRDINRYQGTHATTSFCHRDLKKKNVSSSCSVRKVHWETDHVARTFSMFPMTLIIIIIVSSRGSFAQPSYGIQAQHRSNLLIGKELVFEHEYAVGMRHMR